MFAVSRRCVAIRRPDRTAARANTERSLYTRANGYNYEAVKIFMPANRDKPVIVPYIEHVPPDVTAGIFWLKNRDPQLVKLGPDVIITLGTAEAIAARRATTTIPIVIFIADPLGTGIVTNVAHPGGNVTGIMLYGAE
jgi:hypothetical protein